jgi:hypothetical protein
MLAGGVHESSTSESTRSFDRSRSSFLFPSNSKLRVCDVRKRPAWYGASVVAVILFAGCGGDGNPGAIPENKDPQATRAFIENTDGIKQKSKGGKAAELPPQPPK